MTEIKTAALAAVEKHSDTLDTATSFMDIAQVFKAAFKITVPGQEPPKTNTDYKNGEYGLKVSGIKAREKINEQAREILGRVDRAEDLTAEEAEILKQYSGRGGLTENSVFEYYTPQHVAEGSWDALRANGFTGGNVLDPSTGHGTFSATKPKDAIITGCDIDATGSKVAQLLNPEDKIENKSFEKLAAETPDNTFDAVITNVPFGNVRGKSKFDDPAYKDETNLERYFIDRAIDKVKPGGLCVFVAPINIVGNKGKQWERWRLGISKKAEFLGAHKLPSKTFKSQGTDTVTDIVVFRKHPENLLDKIESVGIEALRSANVVWAEFIEGRYWMGEGKPFIMGKFVPKIAGDRWSRETVDGDIDDAALKAKLAAKFDSRIDWVALDAAEPVIRTYAEGDRKTMNGVEWEFDGEKWNKVLDERKLSAIDSEKFGAESIEELKATLGSSALNLTAEQASNVLTSFLDMMTPLQRDSIRFAMEQDESIREQVWRGSIIGGMIGRYDNSLSQGTADDAERLALQEIVVAEIERFGHPKNNTKLYLAGEQARMFGMFSNSVDEKGNFSDLLAGNLVKSGNILEYDSSNPRAIVEHLFIREGINTISLDDLNEIYTGTAKLDSLGDLADIDGIAIDPNGLLVPMSRFTSGDIYPKIDALRLALAEEGLDSRLKAKYEKQLAEIASRRRYTATENISFSFQHKWLNRKYTVDFLNEVGYKGLRYGVEREQEIEDNVSGATRKVRRLEEDYGSPFGEFRGLDTKGFDAQFLKYLNGENITSSRQELIEEYKRKAALLEEQFRAWMQAHPDADQVTEEFNRRFNGFTPFEHNDGDLGLKNISGKMVPHGYQNSGIRRLSEEGRGFLSFSVGLGKTITALGLHEYDKKMGRTKKRCIAVPPSVLSNWYHEAKKFYGDMSDVFFVGLEVKKDKDGNTVRNAVFNEDGTPKLGADGQQEYQDEISESKDPQVIFDDMWKIPQSTKSLVVMSDVKFGMIPMKEETRNKYVDDMVSRSQLAEKGGATKELRKVSYSDAKSKLKKEGDFADEGTLKKGEFPFFEDMGFTDVIHDECFAYDTEVLTSDGVMKIGDICENRIETEVLSCDIATGELKFKPIVAWMPKLSLKKLAKVTYEHGSFICTVDHKVWTNEDGYVAAQSLRGNHSLQTLSGGVRPVEEWAGGLQPEVCDPVKEEGSEVCELSCLSSEIRGIRPIQGKTQEVLQPKVCRQCESQRDSNTDLQLVRKGVLRAGQGHTQKETILQHKLFGKVEEQPARNAICIHREDGAIQKGEGEEKPFFVCENEGEQSNVREGVSGKDEGETHREKVQGARGERKNNHSAANACGCDRVHTGASCSDTPCETLVHGEVAELLQGGLGDTGEEDRNRSGREGTRHEEVAGVGPKEGRGACRSWVVSVEILEPSDYERYGLGSEGVAVVYDITVADNHNFFANGALVSNCHRAKNNMRGGEETTGLAYLSNPVVSKRGVDMRMKASYLRDTQNGRGFIGLTATPLTNSPMEIYNMLSLVCPQSEFEQFGVYTPDDFVRVFGDIKQVDKLMMTGELKTKDGLVGFNNLDGLRNLFFKYVNQKTAEDFPDQLKLPAQVDVSHDLPLSKEQDDVYSDLKAEAEEAVKPGKKEPGTRPVFSILRDMERVATDLDLYYKQITFVFRLSDQEKAQALIEKLSKTIKIKRIPNVGDADYDDTAITQRATEISIPLKYEAKASGKSYTVSFPDAYESAVVGRLSEVGIAEEHVAHPLTPKYAKLVENCQKEHELNGKQLIFTEEKTQHEKIVRILVHHIPAMKGKIAIINADSASGDKLQQIADDYNLGNYRFVVCNKKAEVGVNLQKGTTAIHHLTFPWTPASIQQRNGRGVRQGNTSPQVAVYYYQAGFDAYKVNLLQKKKNWIGDIMHGSMASAENGDAMSGDEISIMLSSNPEEAKRKILEMQAAKAKQQKEDADRQAMITMTKVLNNAHALATMTDDEKARQIMNLQTKIHDTERDINRWKEKGLTLKKGDKERADLGRKIIEAEIGLTGYQRRLKNIDTDFDSRKADIEAAVKRDTNMLRARAKKEGVPFDVAVLDSPTSTVILPTGQMISLGTMYEVSFIEKTSSRSKYTTKRAAIVKVASFSENRRSIVLEKLTGDLGYGDKGTNPTISDFFSGYNPVKASYSEDEIKVKAILEKKQGYEKLIDGTISKEVFQKHYEEIKWGYGGVPFFLRKEGDTYWFDSSVYDGKVVYPEKNDENFRKLICEVYLKEKRSGLSASAAGRTLAAIFGSGFDAIAMEYGRVATQAEVMAKLEGVYQGWLEKTNSLGHKRGDLPPSALLVEMASYSRDGFDSMTRTAVEGLGDNTSEIGNWRYDFSVAKRDQVKKRVAEYAAEEEVKKQQEIKTDPNFKEVQEEVKTGFAKLGITVKTNLTEMVIPGFKGRAGTRTAPFSKWYFQDENGKSGKLAKTKETLKVKFGAKFFMDAGGDFDGAWWHVPIETDLAEVFKIVAY